MSMSMSMSNTDDEADPPLSRIPYTEKYRTTDMAEIVLNPLNRRLLDRMVELRHIPNMLFYGPPGTGKTTTILSLIARFQQKWATLDRRAVIHLNASDDRGIDVIRNQIHTFVHSGNLFSDGLKIVVLDEVDYMTKNAQQALKTVIQGFSSTVRFCLICNYLSRIDDGLQCELMRLDFNRLPESGIIRLLAGVAENEGITMSESQLRNIQRMFGSDVRSMLNHLQLHWGPDAPASVGGGGCGGSPDSEAWLELLGNLNAVSVWSDRYHMTPPSAIRGLVRYLAMESDDPVFATHSFSVFVEVFMRLPQSQSPEYLTYAISELSARVDKRHAHSGEQ